MKTAPSSKVVEREENIKGRFGQNEEIAATKNGPCSGGCHLHSKPREPNPITRPSMGQPGRRRTPLDRSRCSGRDSRTGPAIAGLTMPDLAGAYVRRGRATDHGQSLVQPRHTMPCSVFGVSSGVQAGVSSNSSTLSNSTSSSTSSQMPSPSSLMQLPCSRGIPAGRKSRRYRRRRSCRPRVVHPLHVVEHLVTVRVVQAVAVARRMVLHTCTTRRCPLLRALL